MSKLDKIITKIEKVEKLLSEIKKEVEEYDLNEKNISKSKGRTAKSETIHSSEELIKEYNNLYEAFLSGDSRKVSTFVKSKTIKYLKEFCKANNISIVSGRQSKQKISDELIRWFQQRKAISKRN